MFFNEETERKILHDSTSRTPYSGNGERLIKSQSLPQKLEPRKIGGSSGVAVYKPASKKIKGGAKNPERKPNAYQEMVKKIMAEKKMNMKDSLKYIKQNNLYKK